MDELIQAVQSAAHLPPLQASEAVAGVLRFLAARLPSPLFGELQVRLGLPLQAPADEAPAASVAPPGARTP